jgi:hypothetical protein
MRCYGVMSRRVEPDSPRLQASFRSMPASTGMRTLHTGSGRDWCPDSAFAMTNAWYGHPGYGEAVVHVEIEVQ